MMRESRAWRTGELWIFELLRSGRWLHTGRAELTRRPPQDSDVTWKVLTLVVGMIALLAIASFLL
jgi:hypothetical protein